MAKSFTFDEAKGHADYCIIGALENIKLAIAGNDAKDVQKHIDAAIFSLTTAKDFMNCVKGVE